MSLVSYAEQELDHAGVFEPDSDYGGMLGQATLNVVKTFADEGHSGFSASLSISMLERLLRYKPLTPIQEPSSADYTEVNGSGVVQHCRDYGLFSNDGGKTWHALDDDYCSRWWKPWTWRRNGRRPVRFPYMPK